MTIHGFCFEVFKVPGKRDRDPREERRIYARVPASFRVDYIHEEEYIISFNRDISVDGMYLCVKNPPPPGSHLKLVFSIGELIEAEVAAIVAWINLSGPPAEHGMGLQFLEPPAREIKETILKYVTKIKILQKNGRQA